MTLGNALATYQQAVKLDGLDQVLAVSAAAATMAEAIEDHIVSDDKAIVLAAQCIWGEITDELWSRATPEQQRRYVGIARAAFIAASVVLA